MRRAFALLQWVLAAGLVLGLWRLDAWLSHDRTLGGERNAVRGGLMRAARHPDAGGVIVLGSSTSADWLPPRWLARLFREPSSEVVDAHVNGCHQGCTFAEVRRLRAEGRHFRVAIFGTNQFQMCEEEHSKRVLQHRRLAPDGDPWPDLRAYLHASRPLRWIARYAFGELSGAYADTAAVQKERTEPILGNTWRRRHLEFVRPHRDAGALVWCAYGESDVAYKRELSRRLYAELAALADETFVLLLPDRSLSADDPAVAQAWERHRQLQRELVAEHPSLHLLDLSAGESFAREDFKDAIHLAPRRKARQRRRLAAALREGGHRPGSR